MISICIPIYNHNVRNTIERLSQQANQLDEEIEIVCIDDKSRDEIRVENRVIESKCKYVELEKNVGRSRIRNMFLKYVSAECRYLIFMDCDLEVADENYLKRYVLMAHKGWKVIVGGHRYKDQQVEKRFRLHYEYGRKCEVRTAEERSVDSNRSFMTGNFMIARDVLDEIRFDERIRGYGHEDTLMGYQLKQHGIVVKHIDNPLLVEDLDDNVVFMRKTEEGVKNLGKIMKMMETEDFAKQVSLLTFYNKVKKKHLIWAVRCSYRVCGRVMKKRFEQGWSNMIALKFYKLGLFVTTID